jgi:hypothetical protein
MTSSSDNIPNTLALRDNDANVHANQLVLWDHGGSLYHIKLTGWSAANATATIPEITNNANFIMSSGLSTQYIDSQLILSDVAGAGSVLVNSYGKLTSSESDEVYPHLISGIMGNGTTTPFYNAADNAQIQAAIDSIQSNNNLSGLVKFSAFKYDVKSSSNVGSNISFKGVLACVSDTRKGTNIFNNIAISTPVLNMTNGSENTSVENITFYSEVYSSITYGYGIVYNQSVQHYKVKESVFQGLGEGIRIAATNTYGDIKDNKFVNCGAGIDFADYTSSNSATEHVKIMNNLFKNNKYWGLNINQGTIAKNIVISHNNFESCTSTNNTALNSIVDPINTWIPFNFQTAKRGMLYARCRDSIISHNTFQDAGITTYIPTNTLEYTPSNTIAWGAIIQGGLNRITTNTFISKIQTENSRTGGLLVLNENTTDVIGGGGIVSQNDFNGVFAYSILLFAERLQCTNNIIINKLANTTGVGIMCAGFDCVVNDNQIHGQSIGIQVTRTGNIIGHNIYKQNTIDVQIDSGVDGTIVTLVPGLKLLNNGTNTILVNSAYTSSSAPNPVVITGTGTISSLSH